MPWMSKWKKKKGKQAILITLPYQIP